MGNASPSPLLYLGGPLAIFGWYTVISLYNKLFLSTENAGKF
jgi:hypothetical protein